MSCHRWLPWALPWQTPCKNWWGPFWISKGSPLCQDVLPALPGYHCSLEWFVRHSCHHPLEASLPAWPPPYFAEVGQNCVHQVYQPTPTAPRLFPHLGQPSQGRGDGSWPGGPGQTFARSPPLLPSQISTNCGGPLIGSQGQKPGVQPWGVEEHHQNWPVSFCQFFFQLNMMVNNG